MASKILFNNKENELIDEFIDIGYMAEEFEVEDENNHLQHIKRASQNRSLQILLSFPDFENFKEEIMAFDAFMNEAQVEIHTFLIFAQKLPIDYAFKALKVVYDTNDEFGEMYGAKIVQGELENCLTKALFLIGKDGALYHIDMPKDLSQPLDLQRIRLELNKVYQSYTGSGCHG